ncbi:MAG TPA: hypothetical protein V6D03_12845 [Candidatus Caenarcaniphilales bacterium]|jgi:hypothetical protein
MSVPRDPIYQELGSLLTHKLKQSCHPEVKEALDRCWISQWCYQYYQEFPTPLQILVVHSVNAAATSCLRQCWQDVAAQWHNLTGSLTHFALFEETTESFQAILFEAIEAI